ncbi:TenA family transcriptional regulator [Kitasatospora sp. GP82]|uniref:TenA family protein n=1 Tax=Kitasatospora sp. GP82 TaxID=3035089 RepID=UPI0024743A26|nr:TenA family transcriptional regulator [Kitasatospora sp. GP82]MDH6129136.1 thiaminase/transcriptional activator TenA [Kitasatospora sp. GP82]
MLQQELAEICEPVLHEVLNHPFWSGLRDGTLPGEALARFVRQDTGFLLPSYARALARCAAAAPDDADTRLFGQSVVGTLEARDGLREAYTGLAGELGLPGLEERAPVEPAVVAHTAFFTAATETSFHAGLGAVLPMVWFNAEVSDHLRDNAEPGTRYAPWIAAYHPGESYRYAVRAFLDMADRVGDQSPPRLRRLITDHFSRGIRHELAFADCCAALPAQSAGKGAL